MNPFCKPFPQDEIWAIVRYCQLRKEGKIQLILCEEGRYYRVYSEIDPWGTKFQIGTDEFVRLVITAEERKAPGKETGDYEIRRTG